MKCLHLVAGYRLKDVKRSDDFRKELSINSINDKLIELYTKCKDYLNGKPDDNIAKKPDSVQ